MSGAKSRAVPTPTRRPAMFPSSRAADNRHAAESKDQQIIDRLMAGFLNLEVSLSRRTCL
jgi:hypothetical protein